MTSAKPKPKPVGLDSPLVPKLLKRAAAVNVWVYRRTNGRLMGKLRVGAAFPRGVPICLLGHTGRKSGQVRTTPLLFLPDGDRIVVVASQGGLPSHPQWYLNILADPDVTVQVRGDVRRMRARTATPSERAELWPRLVDLYADFASYQSWTDREIPVVICEPVAG
jgi:deazaflavin-dependent oxidoreductase (nitroreductase family)